VVGGLVGDALMDGGVVAPVGAGVVVVPVAGAFMAATPRPAATSMRIKPPAIQ